MANHRHCRWLGFAMLGVVAVLCLICNLSIWWLFSQSMAVQPVGFSFVIDLELVRQLVSGVVFAQPALVSIFLAYGKQGTIARVVLAFLLIAIAYAVQLIGWALAQDGVNLFMTPPLMEVAVLLAAQAIGCSLAMWLSRIMRGWELSTEGISSDQDQRQIGRPETITESVALLILVIVAISGPDILLPQDSFGVGAINFTLAGLIGTVVFAPIVFVSLRFRNIGVIGAALFLLPIALPAVIIGILYAFELILAGAAQTIRELLIIETLAASGILSVFLFSLRLAGFRLQHRRFYKKEVVRESVDPFAD